MTNDAATKKPTPTVQILVAHRDYPTRVQGWTCCAPEQVEREVRLAVAQGYRFVRTEAA